MDKIIKERAKCKTKADNYYRQYMETGNNKFKDKASKQYALFDGLTLQLKNPQPLSKSFAINTSINCNNRTQKTNTICSYNKGKFNKH